MDLPWGGPYFKTDPRAQKKPFLRRRACSGRPPATKHAPEPNRSHLYVSGFAFGGSYFKTSPGAKKKPFLRPFSFAQNRLHWKAISLYPSRVCSKTQKHQHTKTQTHKLFQTQLCTTYRHRKVPHADLVYIYIYIFILDIRFCA